jgi:endo-1,4-beta-xylanase
MLKHLKNIPIAGIIIAIMIVSSCKKNNDVGGSDPGTTNPTNNTGNPDTSVALKTAVQPYFANMGLAVTYTPMSTISAYLATVKKHANIVTFGNELKEGSVVGNSGTYNYATADALYNLCTTNGLQVYGHTLVWYSQQNATYLNGIIASLSTASNPAPNLLAGLNGDFESGTGSSFTSWTNLAGGTSSATFSAVAGNGTPRAMQVNVATAGANAYDAQSIGTAFNITSGHVINFSVDIKAAAAGGKVRVVVQNANYLQYDITPTTSWATYTFSLTVAETSPIIRFNFPNTGTYTIDNLTASDPTQATGVQPGTSAQISTAIDNEMKKYITTTMTHYTGKIAAWDIVNEAFLDNGQIRTNTNYTIPAANVSNQFLYGQYIGSKYDANNYILHAFTYAKAADPVPLRFINDYNLEYSTAKTDSMKALVTFVNKNGQLIDGIGTQLHITLSTSLTGIDYAFKTLASTGLKIRISELDVALNTSKSGTYTPDATALSNQSAMYKYVIQSYIKNVPAAQRYGVTVWGVSDTDSWLNTTTTPDAPLLFDTKYAKKPAYSGFLQGLQP